MYWANVISDSDIFDLFQCCLPRPLSLFYMIAEVETWDHGLYLEMCHCLKRFLVGWDNIDLFSVPPESHVLARPAFWHDLETTHWFL